MEAVQNFYANKASGNPPRKFQGMSSRSGLSENDLAQHLRFQLQLSALQNHNLQQVNPQAFKGGMIGIHLTPSIDFRITVIMPMPSRVKKWVLLSIVLIA